MTSRESTIVFSMRISFHVVDDHVSRMIEVEGTLRRVVSGVFEMVKGYLAPRPVYFSDLDDGQTLLRWVTSNCARGPVSCASSACAPAGMPSSLARCSYSTMWGCWHKTRRCSRWRCAGSRRRGLSSLRMSVRLCEGRRRMQSNLQLRTICRRVCCRAVYQPLRS